MDKNLKDAMYQLLYVSHANSELSDEELFQILREARANNSLINVTGLLIYYNGCFMQLLEGEKDTVGSLFRQISLDGRHSDVSRDRRNGSDRP